VKYVFLALATVFAVLGIQVAWFMDPIVTVARVISLNLIPGATLLVDKAGIWAIQTFHLYGGFYDFYRDLKSTLLGVNVHFFATSLVTFAVFIVIVLLSWFVLRFWCRVLCPLGALYALVSSQALLERKTKCTSCGVCHRRCRTGAIKTDASYVKSECVLCMDCVYDCVAGSTEFVFRKRKPMLKSSAGEKGVSRAEFLFLMLGSFLSLGWAGKSVPRKKFPSVIRPPGAQYEERFLNKCVRCGNCMKVCITNGLQPSVGTSGWQGLWTPELVPEIGYCEYNCTLCGNVCPTGAIPKLPVEQKRRWRLGVAEIDRNICIAWKDRQECIVCEEHCPVADKAIKTEEEIVDGRRIFLPSVDPELCIGCGICQNKCPVRPVRAIRVTTYLGEYRPWPLMR